jgi:putative ABC transport system permease protein
MPRKYSSSWLITLMPGARPLSFGTVHDHLKGDPERAAYQPVVFLQPMSRWHLYSDYKDGVNTGGDIQFVWLFGLIGAFVLLLACINFMNLSTARSEKRAKEVGIRKTLGSRRGQLVGQFFSESFMAALIAFGCAIGLVYLAFPYFNQVTGKQISITWDNSWFWLAGMGCTLLTGVIAGSYPAFYLSSFRPIKVLKGFKVSRLAAVPRKGTRGIAVYRFGGIDHRRARCLSPGGILEKPPGRV